MIETAEVTTAFKVVIRETFCPTMITEALIRESNKEWLRNVLAEFPGVADISVEEVDV